MRVSLKKCVIFKRDIRLFVRLTRLHGGLLFLLEESMYQPQQRKIRGITESGTDSFYNYETDPANVRNV